MISWPVRAFQCWPRGDLERFATGVDSRSLAAPALPHRMGGRASWTLDANHGSGPLYSIWCTLCLSSAGEHFILGAFLELGRFSLALARNPPVPHAYPDLSDLLNLTIVPATARHSVRR